MSLEQATQQLRKKRQELERASTRSSKVISPGTQRSVWKVNQNSFIKSLQDCREVSGNALSPDGQSNSEKAAIDCSGLYFSESLVLIEPFNSPLSCDFKESFFDKGIEFKEITWGKLQILLVATFWRKSTSYNTLFKATFLWKIG